MSYVSGFIIGMIIFSAHHKNNIFIKLFFLIITLIAFFLSGSRTYWAACFFSTVIVIIKLNPFKNIKANLSYLTTGIVILCLILTAAFFIKPDPIVNNIIKYFRLESLENLSGRIYVWQIAFEKVYERPLLGYGLGSGDEAFKEKESIRFGNKPSEDMYLKRQRSSLHNGFVQALLDVGIPGFLFYTITIIIANIRMLKSNKKENAAALFGILYFSIINFGQSSILGAATFQGILAWYFIVYGLSQSN
jgi:O-antigen ligase